MSGNEIWERDFDGLVSYVHSMQDLTYTLILDHKTVININNFGQTLWAKEIGSEEEIIINNITERISFAFIVDCCMGKCIIKRNLI